MRSDVVTIEEYNALVQKNYALEMELERIKAAYEILQKRYNDIQRDADLGQTTRKFMREIKQIMG